MNAPAPTGPKHERWRGWRGWRGLEQVSSRRSFVLMGGGALLGLLMAGYSLFTARGTSTLIVPPEDVALVNQQPISRSDYLLQLQTLYSVDLQHASAEQRRKVLDDMIREELFVQRGKELDVASIDPDVRTAMVNSVELEIAADAITAQPGEAQLRSYYDAHHARYASEGIMTLHDYVFRPGDSNIAAEAVEVLKAGPPAEGRLAQWHASDSGKVSGEEFYFAAKIHLGDVLFEAARKLPDGGVSGPIANADGIHVLFMVKNKRPVAFEFAAARDQVLTDYRNDAIGHLRTGDEAFLRKRANILIADDIR
jgi:parvulin-like peptidyl-prolyl isomerase